MPEHLFTLQMFTYYMQLRELVGFVLQKSC